MKDPRNPADRWLSSQVQSILASESSLPRTVNRPEENQPASRLLSERLEELFRHARN
jgi:hypothetical protein